MVLSTSVCAINRSRFVNGSAVIWPFTGYFVPAGPMASGLPNKEKVRIRQLYAEGKVDRQALLEAEAASYHSAGTCTFTVLPILIRW